MFGKNFLNSKEFILALSAVRSAAVSSNSYGEFYSRLGFVYKPRLENVNVWHTGHPDGTAGAVNCTLIGKQRPDTYMLKRHGFDVNVDEAGTKKHRSQPSDIMRALAFFMQGVPLPFLFKSERGHAVHQSFITNENAYVNPDSSVSDVSGVKNLLELACSDYEWQQAVWSPVFSTYKRSADDLGSLKNLYSSQYDDSQRTGFMQSSSYCAFAGCETSFPMSARASWRVMSSAEFHIDTKNAGSIYQAVNDMVYGRVKEFGDKGDININVCGFVGAKYSTYKDELSYGGRYIPVRTTKMTTGNDSATWMAWLTDVAMDICDGKYHGGRVENKYGSVNQDEMAFLRTTTRTPVTSVFASFDNPHDGSSYAMGCDDYVRTYAPYTLKVPVTSITSSPSLSVTTPTGSVDQLKIMDAFLDIYQKSFTFEEKQGGLPWTSTEVGWNSTANLRCPEYVTAVKLFQRDAASKSWATASFESDEGYSASMGSSKSPYHIAVRDVDGICFMINRGYKDGATSNSVHKLRADLSEDYSKTPELFPTSWGSGTGIGFRFSSGFKAFCFSHKEEIINLAMGVTGVPVSEGAKPLGKRTAPECPTIDGVVGMEAQVAAFHSAMSAGKPSMLVGPTGCGKTFLVRQYHKWDNEERKKRGETELPLVIHTFHQESSPTEIIGKATLENGNVVWQESEFMKVFANGGTYFADEFNFAPGGAHAPLFAALNGDDDILVPEAGKTYVRHKDFKFVAACNPASKYGGRQPVDKALASRFFVSATFGYLSPAQEKKLLMSRIDTLTEAEAEKVVSYAQAVRKAESDGHLFIPLGTRDALHIAELLKKGFAWGDAVEYGFAGKSDNDDQHSELMKLAGSAPAVSFDDDAKLKKSVADLKSMNEGLRQELKSAKADVLAYSEKLAKFKAALS